MSDLRQALVFALEKYPERVELIAVEELLLDSARQNERRPAYVKLAVPDELVKALRGPASKRQDVVALVRIPQAVAERADSRIILPGE
ncbi:MAG: hypothetical protein D6696_08840 [Acidobacteria bacterium]|nr:MAG: hypothetical protein D6696_08840 [Acidobacteriota bacterium]